MISAQPTNVWTLKNCKFRAWSKEDQSRAIEFHTADTRTNELHPIGKVVRTDGGGFVYGGNNMQLPNGCFVTEEAIIEASRDDGLTYPISWEVRNPYLSSIVKASDGHTELLNTSVGGLWGENLGRSDGMVRFTDIYGELELKQVPVLDDTKLPAGIIGEDQIANGSVTHFKLGENAVRNNNIEDGAVTHSKLADNAVEGNNIRDGSVTLSSLAGSIGSLLRFRVADENFSYEPTLPTKIKEDDFIIILPYPRYLRDTYISTAEMKNNSFVVLAPIYDHPESTDTNDDFTFHINAATYVSASNDIGTAVGSNRPGIQSRFGFIIFKSETSNIHVCRYLANGNFNIVG